MDIEIIRKEFGDCDWMRTFLNNWTVEAIIWMMDNFDECETIKEERFDR